MLARIFDSSDVVENFEKERILFQGFAIIAFRLVQLLALVIHQPQSIQCGGIVTIQIDRFPVFDDGVVVHFPGKERISTTFVQARFFEFFGRHQHLHLQQIAFSLFDQRRILFGDSGCDGRGRSSHFPAHSVRLEDSCA